MNCDKSLMRLYAVTDRSWLHGKTLINCVEKALKGGATCLQLREKNLSDDEFLKEAIEIRELCSRYRVPFIINDNVNIAVSCKADGIHVGQNDENVASVREAVGDKMLIGVSAQTVSQARLAEKMGADYLGVGAVFPTATKPDADYVPYETLKEICQNVSIPVVAIGGINETNLPKLEGSGIDGTALVSAIFANDDIENTCKRLYKRIGEII